MPTTLEVSAESRSDHFFKWAMRVAVIAVVVIAVATFFTTRSGSKDSEQAAVDAAAALAVVQGIEADLDAQQLVVNRSGCVTKVYSKFFLAITEVIIQEDPEDPSIQQARERLRALIAGEKCAVPDLDEEVRPPVVPQG